MLPDHMFREMPERTVSINLVYRTVGVVLVSVFAAAAGAAEMAKETRVVSDFDRVVLRAVGDLTIEQGEEEKLVVEAEKNVLPKLASQVRSGVLYLDVTPGKLSTEYPIRYYLTVKRLSRIASEGSGQVSAGKLTVPSLELELSGSGSVSVTSITAKDLTVKLGGSADVNIAGGTVTTQRISIDGAGDYAAPRLESAHAAVSIDGSGDVVLNARDTLSVEINGSGDVHYHGNPALSRAIAGAGSVTRASAL